MQTSGFSCAPLLLLLIGAPLLLLLVAAGVFLFLR